MSFKQHKKDEEMIQIESISNDSDMSRSVIPIKKHTNSIVLSQIVKTKTFQNNFKSNIQDNKNNNDKVHVKFESESKLIKQYEKSQLKQFLRLPPPPSIKQKDSSSNLSYSSTRKNKAKWKKRIERRMNSTPALIFMSFVTIFALFSTDIQIAFLRTEVDLAFNIIQILIMCIYALEFNLNCIVRDEYLLSFYFWLDMISTLTLFQDIDYIMNPLMGYEPISNSKIQKNLKKSERVSTAVSQVSSATRATRVLRVVRIARLFRMIKIYKSVLQAKVNKEKQQNEEKRKILEIIEEESSDMSPVSPGKRKTTNDNLTNNQMNNSDGINKIIKKLKIKRGSYYKGESSINGMLHNTKERPSSGSTNLNTNCPLMFNDNNNKGQLMNIKTTPNTKVKFSSKIQNNIFVNRNSDCGQKIPNKNGTTIEEKENKKNKEEDEDDETIIRESRISKLITESINKKVIVLVTAVLLIFPMLSDDFYANDNQICYSFLSEIVINYHIMNHQEGENHEHHEFLPTILEMNDPKYPIVNISYQNDILYENPDFINFTFRYREIRSVFSEDANIHIVYSLLNETRLKGKLNIGQTIFVCIALALSCMSFEDDASSFVLEPLEIMIEIVEKVAHNPIDAKNVEELQSGIKAEVRKIQEKDELENDGLKTVNSKKSNVTTNSNKNNLYEINIVKAAIIKISALLAIGFGEAGGDILKKNLSSNHELNIKLKGKKKMAIFSFCDIRDFNQINLALEEKTMLFVNEIAEIVHSSVDRFKGATNKNIGDSFLSVWKFPNNIKRRKGSTLKKDNLLEIDPFNPKIGIIADCSVLACLRIILKINKNINILAYRHNQDILKRIPNFKLTMGFGLHLGYGIEGTIGSNYKIEASYLSPNVNIAARLETATRQFGVSLLISGVLYEKLTPEMKEICRFIDCVKVKGSEYPLNLYTIDLNYSITPQKSTKILIVSNKEKKKIFAEKKENLNAMIEEYGNVTSIMFEKESYKELIKPKNPEFTELWNDGMDNYQKGDWINAKKCFEECLKIESKDGPGNTLLRYLNDNKCVPPKNWEGVRELLSK